MADRTHDGSKVTTLIRVITDSVRGDDRFANEALLRETADVLKVRLLDLGLNDTASERA